MSTPIHQRKYTTFLSHAHADKKIVDDLAFWLGEVSGIPIWYDSKNLPVSTKIVSHLSKAIEESKSMILVLSDSSIRSGWVEEEYNAGMSQRTQFSNFKIIPIRIDECEVPSFLQTTKWIDLENGKLTESVAFEILYSFYYLGSFRDLNSDDDIYIARSWRNSENGLADSILKELKKNNYRLIGDSQDQKGFDKENRIESLIKSCKGLVAILPHRGDGETSKYIVEELKIAQSLNMPTICIADNNIEMAKYGIEEYLSVAELDFKRMLEIKIEDFHENLKNAIKEHYVFFAKSIEDETERENYPKELIELITGLSCVYGDQIYTGEIQGVITSQIKESLVVLADITNENLNTCIEVGIARGAGCNYHLIAKNPRKSPPFMFRDQQVWFYDNEVELLGVIHKILFPYRRRVMNYELSEDKKWV